MLMIRPAISVVVINHNYAEYLGEAIDSALAQTYPVQILVVDDGSTDTSRTIIDGYGGRVRSLFKNNGGNSSVINAAVPATSGDVVMFLDADDLLHPEAAAAVADAWQEGCSKVQFRLSLIDAAGKRRGVDPAREAPMPTGDVSRSSLPPAVTSLRSPRGTPSGGRSSRRSCPSRRGTSVTPTTAISTSSPRSTGRWCRSTASSGPIVCTGATSGPSPVLWTCPASVSG